MTKGIYRHNYCIDIDMEVIYTYPCSKRIKVKAKLFNRYDNYVYEVKNYIITDYQLKNWVRIDVQKKSHI